jgi:hypothetical protein
MMPDIHVITTRVVVESPFASLDANERYHNELYCWHAMRDCLARSESPYASHEMFTRVLNDNMPQEREAGMLAAQAWMGTAHRTVVYFDRGISPGMIEGILHAIKWGRRIEFRSLYGKRWQDEQHKYPEVTELLDGSQYEGSFVQAAGEGAGFEVNFRFDSGRVGNDEGLGSGEGGQNEAVGPAAES